jgi:two-component system, LytTR family, response regulator
MTILIIEDEHLVALSLINLVKELEPSAIIVGPLGSVKATTDWLNKNAIPDLILADIQLSDGISFDIFSNDRPGCPIIFTTAYNEYAIRAFKLNSIDYLLKPIDKIDLAAAFKKFYLLQSKFSNDTYLQQIKELFTNFQQAKPFKERFAVHVGRSVTLVPVDDIAFFTKEEIIFLIGSNGQKYITDYRSLDEVEELLNPAVFYRANRQHLVNLAFIESYRTDDTGKISLKIRGLKTADIIVSKDKAAEFRKWFD